MNELYNKINSLSEDDKKKFMELLKRKAENKTYIAPQSFEQQRLWMMDKLVNDTSCYNTNIIIKLSGVIDINSLKYAFEQVVVRHDIMRTTFGLKGDEPIQIISRNQEVNFEEIVLGELPFEEVQEKALFLIRENSKKPFNLSKGPLFRIELIKLNKICYLISLTMHHIISDAWSVGILAKELAYLYNSSVMGKESCLEKLQIQYADFSRWQRNILQGKILEEKLEFWRSKLEEIPSAISLPYDGYESRNKIYNGDSINFEFDLDISNSIREICDKNQITTFMFFITVLSICLYKNSNQKDIVIGVPNANRANDEVECLIGFFVNIVAYRINIKKDSSFEEMLQYVRSLVIESSEFLDAPFEKVVEIINKNKKDRYSSIFQVMFIMQNIPISEIKLNNIDVEILNIKNESAQFDMAFTMINSPIFKGTINYNVDLFSKDTVNMIAKHFKNIINKVVVNTGILIDEIEVITKDERKKLLVDFNDTDKVSNSTNLHKLFEYQVEKSDDDIAILYENKTITYRELNEKSNQVARELKQYGIGRNNIVAIIARSPLEIMVAIIAILKSGAAFLPIDPSYPNHRIKYMLEDSNADLIITEDNFKDIVDFNIKLVNLSEENMYTGDKHNLCNECKSDDLAYVIYTSGSTGGPKGVMIEHKSIAETLEWRKEEYNFNEKDNILQLFSFAFDGFLTSVFTPLISGSKVFFIDRDKLLDPNLICKYIREMKITSFICIPSLYYNIIEAMKIEDYKHLKIITLAGEKINPQIINKYSEINKKIEIVNEYGPTENSIVTTIKRNVNREPKVTIGRPKQNTAIYIVDENNRLLPIGVTGEICISGSGLARGYINNVLTEQKFIDNPYDIGKKMYKTGDLGRWLSNGDIEYVGRIDNQVKIRGFRIELGEIESKILQHEDVKETAVVVIDGKDNDKSICSYIVSDKELNELNLRDYLNESLPEHMIPSYFVKLERMPITPNGKLDRRALPKPNLDERLTSYEAPRNALEETLVRVWSEVLGRQKIGINDSFFELGGHSLKAMTLISKIHKETNKKVPLKELFKSPTIKGLSKFIEKAEESIYSKIEKVEEREYYEASSAQKRMYIIQGFDKESMAYNTPQVFEIQGSMDKVKIENTFRKLSDRHEALRTCFEVIDGEIVQKIDKSYEFKLDQEVSNQSIEEIVNDFIRPFDLGKAPLFRAEIVETQSKNYLLIDMHHIISDGVSMSILINEFVTLYNGRNLEPLKLQYKDFASWQNNFLKSEEMKKQEEYWINMFKDEIPVLNMSTDYERPAVQSFEGDSVSFEVDKNVALELKKLTKKTGTTMHMVLLSAFNILLSKYSGQEDIVIGTPIVGRPHADLQNIMGMFVNTLTLRNKPEGNKKYVDFLNEVKENSLKAYDNQSYQLETLIEKLDIVRDTSRNPLFDVMFNMVDTISDIDIKLNDMLLIPYSVEDNVAKFDLTLNAMEQNDEIAINIGYCSKLFNKSSIERLGKHYLIILESITTNNEIKLGEIELLSDEEKNQLLNEFNDTKIEYENDKTIQELFESQVEKTPDNIAVIFEDKKLTYRELNEKSNSLARILRTKGVKADSIVAIMIDKSVEMIIGIMGILKAGGAYLPIDPSSPSDRIKYMLKDSGANTLLKKDVFVKKLEFSGGVIELFDSSLFVGDINKLEKGSSANNLAYVIYTSGTTGKPKGVLIEHRNVVNLLNHMQIRYPIQQNDVYLLKTNYIFDVSVTELFSWFMGGGTLAINKHDNQKDMNNIIDSIKRYKVTHINFVPSMLSVFNEVIGNDLEKVNSLKYVLAAGEELKPRVVYDFYNKFNNVKLENLYGPTETTVYASMYSTDKGKQYSSIPIGISTQNAKLFVVNNNKLQPVGIPGELCISGDGLARGYLNNQELTAEKFVDNPFEQGTKMYKTGDLAKWLPDGNIEFLGRIDNQVKIRGFRIELGEIENKLLQHEGVKEATVIVIEGEDDDKHICAYIVSEKEVSKLNLKDYLKESLPGYMIPSYFVKLDKIPIASNGKIDRRALPKQNLGERLTSYEAPRNAIEEVLVRIWSEVLGIEKIGINDSFFELGGHSLKAMALISKIHKETNKEVPLKELFKSPTIKWLSQFIQRAKENIYSNIEKIENKDYYEASSAQKRMYIIQGIDEESVAYNMPQVFEVQGSLDIKKIEDTFGKLVSRHESLRTYFEIVEDEIVQKIDNNYEFKLKEKVLQQSIEEISNEFIKPFDLSIAPLFRAEIIKIHNKNYLLIDMHHIISDGVSMSILINEFAKLYSGEELQPIKLQYKDFAAWQNSFLKSEEMKNQEEYWIDMFDNDVPALKLPYDYERLEIQSYDGKSVSFTIDKELTVALKKLAKETETTMHMIVLSAFNILLSQYSGQEDVVIGVPIAGRPHVDLHNVMGVFINTLAIRNKPKRSEKYIEFLKEVKENSLKAYENQNYPIEFLVEKLNLKRNKGRNLLFDVMFNTLNIESYDIELKGLVLKPYIKEKEIAKFDLNLTLKEDKDNLQLDLIYCTKLFNRETIEVMRDSFIDILEIISHDKSTLLTNIVNRGLEEVINDLDLLELDDGIFID